MNDKKLIITGLIIFIVIVVSPFLLNMGKASTGADPVIPEGLKEKKGECIFPKEEMKAEHMQILDKWRETVVRKGERVYVAPGGKEYNMSLSSGENSCIGCHSNKTEFCDRCHDYASVRPYCWDCHNEPKEKN
jgi:hypothetical protein